MGGKDELAVFYRLCKKLFIDCRIIADYNALMRGKLRECFCADKSVKQQFVDKGHGTDPSNYIGSLEGNLLAIGDELNTISSSDADISHILSYLKPLYANRANNLDKIIDIGFLSILRHHSKVKSLIPSKSADIDLID